MASHIDPTPHAPRHSIPSTHHKTARSSTQDITITAIQSQTLGRTVLSTALSGRHAMQLPPHALFTSTQPHTTAPRWPLRAHTRRPSATEPSSNISPSQHEQHLLSHEDTILSTLPTALHSMVTTPWSTHRPLPTQLTFSTPTMETTHRQHSTYTAIHITQCHPITAVPYRQTGVASRRSRTAESTAFLPTTLFPRMSHYLEHTTTLSTTTRPY